MKKLLCVTLAAFLFSLAPARAQTRPAAIERLKTEYGQAPAARKAEILAALLKAKSTAGNLAFYSLLHRATAEDLPHFKQVLPQFGNCKMMIDAGLYVDGLVELIKAGINAILGPTPDRDNLSEQQRAKKGAPIIFKLGLFQFLHI